MVNNDGTAYRNFVVLCQEGFLRMLAFFGLFLRLAILDERDDAWIQSYRVGDSGVLCLFC